MGITMLTVEVANPSDPAKSRPLEFLVDMGAMHSVVPREILEEIGIKATGTEVYRLADGSKVERKKGVASFRYADHSGGSSVIFGEPGDFTLLGVVTLEDLGFGLDPLKRELLPLPMLLA
jgi:predicted aspartyl protease